MPRDSAKDKIADDLAAKVMKKFWREAVAADELADMADAGREFDFAMLAHMLQAAAWSTAILSTTEPKEAGTIFGMLVALERERDKKRQAQEG